MPLLIVPLPPPITGHSLASQVLVDGLGAGRTDVVDLSNGSLHDGRVSSRRLREVAKVLGAVWRKARRADTVYLTISESRAGNLKDLFIYALCAGRLSRMCIHLHGGTIGADLFERHALVRRLNATFIRRLGAVIVTGESHRSIFTGMVAPERLHVVPNFAQDDMFVTHAEIDRKFADTKPLRVLYLSGMIEPKGYLELANAYLSLDDATRASLRVDFAGNFDTPEEEAAFRARIAGAAGVRYHGLVTGDQKRRLLAESHVLCLPSRLREGQPLAILEAYASGCAVLATGKPGIRDVFADGVNGFEIEPGSVRSIAERLPTLSSIGPELREMAHTNLGTAVQRHRTRDFVAGVARILRRLSGHDLASQSHLPS